MIYIISLELNCFTEMNTVNTLFYILVIDIDMYCICLIALCQNCKSDMSLYTIQCIRNIVYNLRNIYSD